ncbi:MAG TPA: helix-turn-helix transcriptional regulator [Pseudonocardiaceae bacterium]|nr:helix-turn-helix transcriptional regulator [Pseudonocardiaceae bacterium]
MDTPTIGALLRRLRVQAGRSQSEQADMLSTLAGRPVARNEVSRWEHEGRLLTPFWQEHYAASFGVPVTTLRRAVATSKAKRRQGKDASGPVRRREFIGTMAGLALPVPPLTVGQHIGAADVQRLSERTARLRRLDDLLGGADTYRLYVAELDGVASLLNAGRHTAEVGLALRSLLAERAQLAGWSAFDAGYHDNARRHFRASLAAAEEADDSMLSGNALAFLAYQQTATGDRATATAEASYAKVKNGATPAVRTLLLERLAWSHAVAGQPQEADRALGMARDALHTDSTRPEPDWVFWVDSTEIEIMTGRCWTELRRPLRAVPVLENALAGFSDTHARDKSLYLTWLAESYRQAGEIEQAATTATRALDLATGVGSVRPLARLRVLARRLAPHRAAPDVAALLDRLTAALSSP